MRTGAALVLVLLVAAAAGPSHRAGEENEGINARPERAPRGPYLLRQIFGDLSLRAPEIWGLAPGTLRRDVPGGTDMGEEERRPGSPTVFTRDVSGRATVTFVFDGGGTEARLDHISVTVVEAPSITPRAVLAHLTKTYGVPDPVPEGEREELLGSWQKGAVLLRHFPSAHFFEVTLSSSHDRSAAVP